MGGRWRSGQRAGASWRRPPVACAFRSSRFGPAAPPSLFSSLPPSLPPLAPPPPPRSDPAARLAAPGRPGAGGGAGRRPPRASPRRPSDRPSPPLGGAARRVCVSVRAFVLYPRGRALRIRASRPKPPRVGGASRDAWITLGPLAADSGLSVLPVCPYSRRRLRASWGRRRPKGPGAGMDSGNLGPAVGGSGRPS